MKLDQDARSVYVILNKETNRVKIGYSRDPNKRVRALQHQGGCKMEVIYATKPIYEYAKIEGLVHERFRKQRYYGEWFSITTDAAVCSVQLISKKSEVCSITKRYESGVNPTKIAQKMKVSRSGVVKYLKSRGVYKENSRVTGESLEVASHFTSSVAKSALEEMVKKNNAKREVVKKNRRKPVIFE